MGVKMNARIEYIKKYTKNNNISPELKPEVAINRKNKHEVQILAVIKMLI